MAEANLYHELGDLEQLALSWEATAGYLESCAEKHNAEGREARIYSAAVKQAHSLALNLRAYDPNRPAFRRYLNAHRELTERQALALYMIKIDYQARIGGEFVPASVDRFLADLTAMAFAIGALEETDCLVGVGGGLTPRRSRASFSRRAA